MTAGRATVLFALEREAAPFRRIARDLPGVTVHVTGVGARAGPFAERLFARSRPDFVVIAGFCGALDPALAAGNVIEPGDVVDGAGGYWPCAAGTTSTHLLTVPRLVATPVEKCILHTFYHAAAVDMESAHIAAVCTRHGVPFRVVRTVSDTAETALSPRLVTLLSGGTVSPLRGAAALVRQPSLLMEFRRLARDTSVAAANMAGVISRVIRDAREPHAGNSE